MRRRDQKLIRPGRSIREKAAAHFRGLALRPERMVFVVALIHVCDSTGLPEPYHRGSGQQLDCEWQILEQIPPVQPAWLTDEPERPFQTRGLHPLRGSWHRIRRER